MRTLLINVARANYVPVPFEKQDPARKAASALVDHLLSKDPARRPTARAILGSAWLKKAQQILAATAAHSLEYMPHAATPAAAHVESHSLGLLPSAAEPQPTTEPVPVAQQTMAADPEAASGHRTASQTVSFFRRLLDMVPAADYGLTGEDLDAIKAESAAAEEQRHTEAQESMLMLDAAH